MERHLLSFSFRSLRVKILFFFLLPSLGVLLISSALQLFFDYRAQQQLIYAEQKIILAEASHAVRQFIDEKFGLLDQVSTLEDLAYTSTTSKGLTLRKLLGRDRAFRQLAIIDERGAPLLSASRYPHTQKNKFAEFNAMGVYERTQKLGAYISPVYIDELSSEPVVLVAVPIKDIYGESRSVLSGEMNLKFLWDLVGNIKVVGGGAAYVVDEKGDLLAFGDTLRVLRGENLSALAEVAEFIREPEDEQAILATGILGTMVVTTHVPLISPNWAVIVETPWREAYRSVIEGIIRSLLIILASVLLIIATSLYASRSIIAPVRVLRDATREISKGNFNIEIPVTSADEIGEVTTTFNEMSAQLGSTYSQMEKRVEERTRELRQKVSEAEALNKFMVGRELKMIELKKRIADLESELAAKGGATATEKPTRAKGDKKTPK